MKNLAKIKFSLLAASFACIFLSCDEEAKPAEVLSESEMVPVLKELEIAYAGVDQTVKDPKERIKKYEEMNGMILKKNKTDKTTFYNSYQWYEIHPILLDTIFKQVVSALNTDLANIRETPTPPSKVELPK